MNVEVYLDTEHGFFPFQIPPGHFLQAPASQVHSGSEVDQPHRVYMLASTTPISDAQKVAVKLAAEHPDGHY